MQDLLPKMPGGYIGVRLTPPLNNIFPKPPKVPPPPGPEKYYAATQICTSKTGTMNLNGHILNNSNTMNHNGSMKTGSNHSNNSNGSNTTASLDGRNGGITPTTPLNHQLNSYSDFDTLLIDDEIQLKEFPRDKLVIVSLDYRALTSCLILINSDVCPFRWRSLDVACLVNCTCAKQRDSRK